MNAFLPMTKQDMAERGWDTLDFIFVSGDAYVDHPSFGPAILCRLLEKHGYRVGIIAQPDWRGREDFCQLGRPRLAFLVSSGNMDSLLNKFTAARKKSSLRPETREPSTSHTTGNVSASLVKTAPSSRKNSPTGKSRTSSNIFGDRA